MSLKTVAWMIKEYLQVLKRPYCFVYGHDAVEALHDNYFVGTMCVRCRKKNPVEAWNL